MIQHRKTFQKMTIATIKGENGYFVLPVRPQHRKRSMSTMFFLLVLLLSDQFEISVASKKNKNNGNDNNGGNADRKEIVFFAGPHKAAASSVEKFFHNHVANGASFHHVWPRVPGNFESELSHEEKVKAGMGPNDNDSFPRHKVFNLLVTAPNNERIQQRISNAISAGWKKSRNGVIIGSEEFDRLGKTPSSHYDAILAMGRVINHLQIQQQQESGSYDPIQVSVVLNFRTPRLSQWASHWKHATSGNHMHYHKYICSSKRTNSLWEFLDTAMNPLRLADTYRKQGWKVYMIDMGGVCEKLLDISHVIACDVLLHHNCEDGWVKGNPNNVTYNLNSAERDFKSLTHHDKQNLEQLLRERDCFYQPTLGNDDGFVVLHNDTVWNGCLPDKQDLYEKLTDTTYLLNIIRSQKGCAASSSEPSSSSFDIGKLLVGDVKAMTHHTTQEQMAIMDTTNTLGEEPLLGYKGRSSATSDEGALTSMLFLLIVLIGGVYQLALIHRQPAKRTPSSIDVSTVRDNHDGIDHHDLNQRDFASSFGGEQLL